MPIYCLDNGVHLNNHLLHNFLILFPLLVALIILARDKGFLVVDSHFKRFVMVMLVLFVAMHAHFGMQSFMAEHQAQSQIAHPCCMPQVAVATTIFIALLVAMLVYLRPLAKPEAVLLFIPRVFSVRAPPILL